MKYLLSISILFCTIFAHNVPANNASFLTTANYSLYAQEDAIRDVIRDIAVSEGIPVEIDDSVTGTMSATFTRTTRRDIFQQIVTAYGLSWYFDGHVLYVDLLSNNKSATINLEKLHPREFKKHLMELGVYEESSRMHWRSVDERRVIHVSGPATFVDKVLTLANKLDNSYQGTNAIYKWVDAKGLTNYSSDISEVPPHAEMIELPKAHIPNITLHQYSRSSEIEKDTE